MPVREETWQQLKNTAANDLVQETRSEAMMRGWPGSKVDIPECEHPYFDIQDEFIVQDELVYKGQTADGT